MSAFVIYMRVVWGHLFYFILPPPRTRGWKLLAIELWIRIGHPVLWESCTWSPTMARQEYNIISLQITMKMWKRDEIYSIICVTKLVWLTIIFVLCVCLIWMFSNMVELLRCYSPKPTILFSIFDFASLAVDHGWRSTSVWPNSNQVESCKWFGLESHCI